MRSALAASITVLLIAVLAWSVEGWPPPTNAELPTAAEWRRTASGWENRANWPAAAGYARPVLHPLLVGAFFMMASLVALLCGDGDP
jgi:hypothetical protein